MVKVKVSKSLLEQLDDFLLNNNENDLLRMHAEGNWCRYDEFNKLSHIKLASILINGYEVEETAEEKILNKMDDMYETACTTCKVSDQWFANGFNKGIVYINEMLDLKLDIKDRYK